MNTTRRHPRTLQEAFGPYTDSHIHEPRQPYRTVDLLIAALGVAALFAIVIGAI